MWITDLLSGRRISLTGRSVTAANQSRVRQKVAHIGKAADLVHFIKDRHRQDASNARDRLQAKERLRVVDLGGLLQVPLKPTNQVVVKRPQLQIEFDRSSHTLVFKPLATPCRLAL